MSAILAHGRARGQLIRLTPSRDETVAQRLQERHDAIFLGVGQPEIPGLPAVGAGVAGRIRDRFGRGDLGIEPQRHAAQIRVGAS
jgi:hypothetical protein